MFLAAQFAQQAGARHYVIHEARTGRLSRFAVVDDLISEYLARALHHAAVQLAFYDGVVDNDTAIINGAVRHDFRRAGFFIYLDFGDVAAVGERWSRIFRRP